MTAQGKHGEGQPKKAEQPAPRGEGDEVARLLKIMEEFSGNHAPEEGIHYAFLRILKQLREAIAAMGRDA